MPFIDEDVKLDFSDVLFLPCKSALYSRSQVSLTTSKTFKSSGKNYSGVPIMASNMDSVGTFEVAKHLHSHDLFTVIHKHYTPESWIEFAGENKDILRNVAISTGISQDDLKKIDEILHKVPGLEYICIDVANGYSEAFVKCIESTRAKYPDKTIIAGNVVTAEMVEELLKAGADIIKIGIGPGSVCTTRKMTGVGYPQFSAVKECAEAAHRLGGHIISDGGCVVPGDISKAFGAGADFVMLGGMLAGHDECPGEVEVDPCGQRYKLFYGMASKHAQEKYNGGLAEYRASEGRKVRVPYRGRIDETILEILGGVRSCCTYTGSATLEDMAKNARFIKVNRQLNEVYSSREIK